MRSKRLWGFLPALLSALLVLGTATVFSGCAVKDDGTWMRCHEAQAMVLRTGIGTTILLFLAALLKNKPLRTVLYGLGFAACVVLFLLPGTLLPMCMMHTMRCYTVMQPFVRIMAGFTGIDALIQGIRVLRGKDA